MRRTSLLSLGLVAVTVIATLAIFLGTRGAAPEASETPSPLIGHRAPAVVGTTLEGRHLDLSKDRGKVVVVDFWSSWCDPCRQSAPELVTFAWRDRAVADVVGVVWNDERGAAQGFDAAYGVNYPSIFDSNGQIANSFGVTNPPTIFIIDRHGRVVTTLLGAVTATQLAAVVSGVTT